MSMSKIRELESVLGAGARDNKYRVIFPYFGRELDIQTHDVTAPGRSIGTVDVFLKGRKYQLAGDRSDEGQITLSFYNDPNMIIRRFFLQVIAGMQNFNVPVTIDGGTLQAAPDVSTLAGTISQRAQVAFDEIKNNFTSISELFRSLQPNSSNRVEYKNHFNQRGVNVTQGMPWYQTDISIQQLDHNGNVMTDAVYHSAFITDVSDILYQDEVGNISSTTLTLTYTGVSYGDDALSSVELTR